MYLGAKAGYGSNVRRLWTFAGENRPIHEGRARHSFKKRKHNGGGGEHRESCAIEKIK